MHEMAIAGALLDSVLRHAGERRVTHVQIRVGHLRQVVPTALEFSWQLITHGTPAEGAALGLEHLEAVGVCRTCGERSAQDGFPLHCASCTSLDIEIVQGEELSIDWLEVDEAAA